MRRLILACAFALTLGLTALVPVSPIMITT